MCQILYETNILNATLHYAEFYKKMKTAYLWWGPKRKYKIFLKNWIFCEFPHSLFQYFTVCQKYRLQMIILWNESQNEWKPIVTNAVQCTSIHKDVLACFTKSQMARTKLRCHIALALLPSEWTIRCVYWMG
jgi:hypothetical protein